MFIELVDSLRCIADHEDTWLVAAVAEFRGRHLARGSLGCPVCRTQYQVENGEVAFGRPGGSSEPGVPPDEDTVLRARALLDLAEPGGLVALYGDAASLALALEEETQATFLLVNPQGVRLEPGVSTIWVEDRLPLAPGVLRAAMVGAGPVTGVFMANLATAVRAGGRIVAPVEVPLPDGVAELARDTREWVAERSRERVSAPMPLRRAQAGRRV